MEIPKQYSPKDTEDKWSAYWIGNGFCHADCNNGGESYSIVIPPPNVTAALHMGHALNNTVQDIIIRWRRMQGFNTLWMPGTDHAGIATQNMVEKTLAKEGRKRDDLGRDKFVDRVWAWRKEYGGKIINQLKKLGCSCDWERERFTMDEGLSQSVLEVFVRLYKKGLIYQGNYIINWCVRCGTALSDEEAEHRELDGSLYYINYDVAGSADKITVATTRPETMLGDTAVALNPKDPRLAKLRGKKVVLPVLNRELLVIEDDFVDSSFGTGIVKVTPAHDPNDFEMGLRHNLPSINVMNHDGTMNENAGVFSGMDRFECRKKLIEILKNDGYLVKIDKHIHSVGHCYRCHSVVEPRVSKQWFVKMKPLAQPAIDAVKEGRIKFIPKRWEKVYLEWMENIRDWCISRQIWWGHRIPVWYCKDCDEINVEKRQPEKCAKCGGGNLVQDNDVLDTWFSSWLWPFSTFGWPEQTADLKFFYPTNTLVTAPEILFFWVARMIMAGIEFMGDIPFTNVCLHGTVRDATGAKMSKSLGNTIDPLDVIDEFGADALRFSIILITAQGQDVYLSPAKFEIGRNFANKIWNASRFLLMNFEKNKIEYTGLDDSKLTNDDKYILGLLNKTISDVTSAFEQFRFNEAAQVIYDFFWHSYCDKYIESVKSVLYSENDELKNNTLMVLFYVLDQSLKLLHPFMPFITEEIWHLLRNIFDFSGELSKYKSIMASPWPKVNDRFIDDDCVSTVSQKYDMVSAGRNLRSEYDIPPGAQMKYVIKPDNSLFKKLFEDESESMKRLLNASNIEINANFEPRSGLPSGVVKSGTVYMLLEGGFDTEKEIQRLDNKLNKINSALDAVKNKLANDNFVKNAPADIIEKERRKETELLDEYNRVKNNLDFVKSV